MAALLALCISALSACQGGGSRDDQEFARGSNAKTDCNGQCADASTFLSEDDVRRVLGQAVAQARALDTAATIAVVDRVGNVLAVFRMTEVLAAGDRVLTIVSQPDGQGGSGIDGGLEGLQLPVSGATPGDGLAAIAKAITGAYLSSEGNAFSTRTANQIVQRHFNPGEDNQPGGPLFGVQFSQLACSDFSLRLPDAANAGPKRSPLGLAADPGGFPLYKNGTPVGGIGVISDDFVYGLDPVVSDFDRDRDELIALAGTHGYAAPADREAGRITVEGKTLRFSDADFDDVADAARNAAPVTDGVEGNLIAVRDYYQPAGGFGTGMAFGQPASGIRPDADGDFPGRDAFVLVDDGNMERFDPQAGTALSAEEVRVLLDRALEVANAARAQIRYFELESTARVTISVVDTDGTVLGMVRSRDAPVFGADVSLQKARTAVLFSSTDAADFIEALPDTQYLNPGLTPSRTVDPAEYVQNVIALSGDPSALRNGIAFSDRAGGNLSRPNFPDGLDGKPPGPLSKPPGEWSPFSTGLQLDMDFNALVSHLLYLFGAAAADVDGNCVGVPFAQTASIAAPRIANGAQIFPGSVPIYRGDQLIGGIGVSGDGIDQDDMIAFLGVHRAGEALGTVNNAPPAIRADTLTLGSDDTRLRYVNCPQSPFLDSDEQDVCAGK
jgi:uncharacterized protein GlcG (DUF336 family)